MGAENIYEAIRAIADGGAVACDTGKAQNVDADKGVCDVEISGKSPALGALLGNAESGVMTVPKEGSVVVVVWATPVTAVVVLAVEVKEVRIMGGKLGGMVKIKELKENLNSLKNYVETLKNAVSAGFGSVLEGYGTASKTGFDTTMAAQSITIKDMENKKVKQ